MVEILLGIISFIFATTYNAILFTLHMKCADGEYVSLATFLMAVNTMKDMAIITIILYKIFLG